MLRKHGGNKAKREVGVSESEGSVGANAVPSQFTEMSSPSPIFGKSVSTDPPGSENERPSSQQSGRGGGKKKILSNFLSNLFGNNKISESDLTPESDMSKKKSSSHESVNSVLSSSSFSYVTPKKYRGKPTKGKRIPVDDPTYGGGTRSAASNVGKNNDVKTKPLGTIDKIGIKIGLKKKYNLQSCESLQYIDACCDEGPPSVENIPNMNCNSQHNDGSTEVDSVNATENPSSISELSAECQAITQHFAMPPPSPETKSSLDEKPPSPESSLPSPSSPSQQLKLQFMLSTPTPLNLALISPVTSTAANPATTTVTTSATPSSHRSIPASSVLKTTVTTSSTASVTKIPATSTQTSSIITAPASSAVNNPATTTSLTIIPVTNTSPITPTPTTPPVARTPTPSGFINPAIPSTSMEPVVYSILSENLAKTKGSKTFETHVPKQAPETPPSSVPEPVASTSAASMLMSSHPPIKPSLFPVGSSNTWSNSTRRKRRAPQPPANNSPFRFPNTEDTHNTSPDVPCSSAQAASLMKFSRLNEQPHSSDTFEIRPRKKERSLEPFIAPRPPSIDGSYITNSLCSHPRFGHKRANSESCSTNTRGRIHIPGKKKAPAPPNPFGDPNATIEPTIEDVNTSEQMPTTSETKPKPSDKPPLCPVVAKAVKPLEIQSQQEQSQTVAAQSLNDSTTRSERSTDTSACISSALISVEPSVIQPEERSDLMEEIRQNMLNDQQERQQQQLGYSTEVDNIPTTILQTYETTHSPGSQELSRTSDAPLPVANVNGITENDIQAAKHTLISLSTSVSPKCKDVPSDVKTKLSDLKQEAERSPLNVKRNKTRPTSIGSSIYENPLALFLGKSSGSSANTANDSATDGDSPRATPKPWYKRSASGALIKPFGQKSKPTSVKPFTSLVKFSELDKETSKIIEENKRKSAEQKFNENAQELIALFSNSFPDTQPTDTDADSRENNISQPVQPTPPKATSHIKVSTTAQVHSIAEEVEDINQRPTPTAQTNLPSALDSLPEITQPTITNNGSSSPPTFQSVHAASKHRQIKPLLTTSPISNIRSEKLAIVQPQANLSNQQESTPIPTPRRSLDTSVQTITPVPQLSTPNVSLATSTSIDVQVNRESDGNNPTHTSNTTITPVSALPISNKSSSDAQWDCPRCTLKNSNWRALCEICFYRKDTTNSASSYISSILQRVNAEIASTKVTSSTSSSAPITTNNSVRRLSATFSNGIPSSVTATTSVITPSSCSSTVSNNASRSIPSRETQVKDVTAITSSHLETKSDIPPCENFLSQLPVKQDLAKEEKLQGIKLHEDPELEELDVGKLREVRLAYFQRQQSATATTTQSASGDSVKNTQNNNLAYISDSSHLHINNNPPRDNVDENERATFCNQVDDVDNGENGTSSETEKSHHSQQAFSDNEDDFLDYMLQLNDENTTNVANITGSLPRPLKPPSSPSPSVSNSTPAMAPTTQTPSPILFLQNRYRPRLEAIREGNSQDYTYCYSSSEITQIYENWQANQNSGESINKFVVNSPTSSPTAHQSDNSVQSFLPTHLLDHQQHQQTSTTTFHSPNEPHLSHVYPTCYSSPSKTNPTHLVPIVLVDHQPHANNRLSDNSDKSYVNTIAPTNLGVGSGARTPTPNESANFSCTTSSPVCFPTFPLVNSNNSHSVVVNDHHNHPINNMNRSGRDRHLSQLPPFRYSETNNYENNTMNFAPGGSRRLTYEDYRKMGAIPKGYPFNARNDDWSSESSCDTESSRGFWGRGANPDSPLGMTRRGTLDFCQSQENGFPDQTTAVGKLMKRLEAAIANGDHRLAATLAHDLALMKVNCVVAKINQPFSIRVYVEDRFMQQGPFLVHVTAMMTVCELKGKIESDWGIPSGFQKWILGRRMAEDDNLSMSAFEMAEDSMAFLFLVTPEIGNNGHSGLISVDTSKTNNFFSVSEPIASTSGLGRNITENCRKSVSPTRHNMMATYNNVNENLSHVYNNLFENTSNPVPINSKKPDFLITRNRESPAKKMISTQSLSPNSSKNASPVPERRFEKSARLPNLTTSVMQRENEVKEDNLPPPPLPSRSPIPPQALPPKPQQNKAKVTKTASKTFEPANANSGSLKSNQKTPKSQNTSVGGGSNKDINNACRNQQSGISPDTLSAASALTLSLQQKLAEFKVVAEQTFSKPSQNSQPVKEQSPAPLKTKGAKHPSDEGKANAKDSVPKRKTGKITISLNKEKVLSSAHSSTEKLEKENSKQDHISEKSVVSENRFNGVLLSTSVDNEPLEPPERSDKSKDVSAQNLHKRPPKGTKPNVDQQKLVSTPERETPQANFPEISAENVSTPQKLEKAVEIGIKDVQDSVNELESLVTQVIASTVPQPKPRGLKKQQSLEKPNQAIEPPKPVPRTTVSKMPSGAKSDSKTSETGQEIALIPTTIYTIEGTTTGLVNHSQVTMDEGCQTTLPFPAMKQRANPASSPPPTYTVTLPLLAQSSLSPTPLSRTASPSINAESPQPFNAPIFTPMTNNIIASPPPQLNGSLLPASKAESAPPVKTTYGNDNGTVLGTNTPLNDPVKGLLRPSEFVSHAAPNKSDFHFNASLIASDTVAENRYHEKSHDVNTSVLLPLITANTVLPSLDTKLSENSKDSTTNHIQGQLLESAKQSTFTANIAQQSRSPSASVSAVANSEITSTKPEEPRDKSKEDNVNSYLHMMELMEKQDLIYTTEDAECPVCFALLPIGEGILLRDCLHTFCKECLVGCVQYADDSAVKCPYRDNSYACNNNLQEREIKALVPAEVFEKYLARSVKLAESKIVNTFHCKTPDCTGWCVFEDDVNVFVCPVCKIRNCLTCAAIHEGVDCLKFQRELAIAAETDEDAKQSRLMLEKMIQRGEALECPACHVVLLKKWGCDWVRCSYCKTEICWVTKGFRWGKGGKGDLSGGCRCGVNGVKCHPKCTYCH